MSTIVPFGPQHPVLPEPIQLRLELEDERVVSAVPMVGYVHRGLEKLGEEKDFIQDTYLIERICGICSFMHSMSYCMGIEEVMSLQVPDRALYLRVVWSELHRIHSHLLRHQQKHAFAVFQSRGGGFARAGSFTASRAAENEIDHGTSFLG